MSAASPLPRPTTLVEEILANDEYDRRNRLPVQELTHLEAEELARHIEETCNGDPRYDFGSYLTAGLDDMLIVDRKHLNLLVRKLLIGEITVQQQADLNEIMVKAMLEHGVHEVRAALNQASVGHEIAATLARMSRGQA